MWDRAFSTKSEFGSIPVTLPPILANGSERIPPTVVSLLFCTGRKLASLKKYTPICFEVRKNVINSYWIENESNAFYIH